MAPLFHVSEEAGIRLFEPRPSPSPKQSGVDGNAVWAIDEDHLANYLLPRDCPRVTYRATSATTSEDLNRFFSDPSARRVIAIESRWFPAVSSCRLYAYEMPPAKFQPSDAAAGYFISREPVSPVGVIEIDDAIGAMLARGVELRLVPDLWALRDAIIASSVEFSIIRFRNAAPKSASH